jgi:hypothetical protein
MSAQRSGSVGRRRESWKEGYALVYFGSKPVELLFQRVTNMIYGAIRNSHCSLGCIFSPSPPLCRTEVSPPGLTTSLSFCCRGKHLRPLVTSTARWLTHVLCKNFCICIRLSLCQSDNSINPFFYWWNRHCADSVYGITLFLRIIRHCLQLLVDNSDINTVRNYRRLMGHTQEINKVAIFLAYFPKMKVGLSNHLSVCLSVCVSVCPPLISSEPLGRFSWHLVWR